MPENPERTIPAGPRRPRRRTAVRLAAGAAACGTFLAPLLAAGGAGAASSPAALVAASKSAATKQHSAHFVAVSSLGANSVTIVADVGQASGKETIRLRNSGQTGLISGRYDGKAVYFRGDANGLVGYLGMPSSLATKYAGRWIAFTSDQKSYAAIAKSLTLPEAIAQISMAPPYTSSTGPRAGGSPTVLVRGTSAAFSSSGSKGSATMTIVGSGTPLPVTFSGSGTQSGKTERGNVVFTKWNEPLNVVAPSSSVNADTITSPSSSGSSSSSSGG